MLNDQEALTSHATTDREDQEEEDEQQIREIHALTPPRHPPPPPAANRHRRREPWETHSHLSSSLSTASTDGENFTSMSREFSALVLAGSTIDRRHSSGPVIDRHENEGDTNNNLRIIGEDDLELDTNPLAIVPDNNPFDAVVLSPRRGGMATAGADGGSGSPATAIGGQSEVSVQRVKKEEVETKISAWQNAKVAKINNRFKREESVIVGWEKEQIEKAASWMKKVERKLEEKRARALEKMQNEIAKAHKKAAERKASAEAKRGTKLAKVFEIANLMRAVGRPPAKKSFF